MATQRKCQFATQCRPYHQQCADILAADAAVHLYASAVQRPACDAQRRKTFFAKVRNVGAKAAKRLHKDANRAVTHALSASERAAASGDAQKGREKAHSRASCSDIDGVSGGSEGRAHGSRVVAVRKIAEPLTTSARERVQHQRASRQTFACRQPYVGVQSFWRRQEDAHNFRCLIFSPICAQSYEKSSAEQKKLVSFFCRDGVTSTFSLVKVTKSRVQNKRKSFLFSAERR